MTQISKQMNIGKPLSWRCFAGTIVLCATLLYSCGDDEETSYSSTYSSYIRGTLTTNIHDYSVKGTTLLLTADGITSPIQEQVSFRWTITDTEEHNIWGRIMRYKCKDESGSFTISMSALAYDNYGQSTSHVVTLIDSTFAETVKGIEISPIFTDARDGQEYMYRNIGSLDWMTQNLNWDGAGRNYKNESEYGIIFGRYYSWDEATNPATCPAGWRLPANADWENLGNVLNGGVSVPFETNWKNLGSNAAADAIINVKMWPFDVDNLKKNTHGWNALPAGKMLSNDTSADNGKYGYWWSADSYSASNGFYRYIIHNSAMFYYMHGDKSGLYLSVRCVR